ncbi:transmembrane amino acid transporter protein [Ditylenchus destructor]|nr:transmembrane amino acid transporter protein [Ditylenchus destructor]
MIKNGNTVADSSAYEKTKLGEWSTRMVHPEKLGDYYLKGGELVRRVGIHWLLASFLICADIAGSGIVALPIAIAKMGFWLGIVILALAATAAISSGVMLGESWTILIRRFPIYRTHTRKPYSELAQRALGAKMRIVVSVFVNFTQFGATTVFLLLSAKNVSEMLSAFFSLHLDYCIMILAVALFIYPITLLKSPKDFWGVIVGGMLSTIVAMFLIMLGSVLDWGTCRPHQELPPLKINNVLGALGTILFTYGGHSAFPTVQHDMKRPSDFRKSALFAITGVSVLNMMLSIFAVLTYGDSLRDSVVTSMQTFWIQQALLLMITVHCVMTVTLIINPLNQSAEELFKIPQVFSIKRVAVRACTLGLCVFVAESIPNFGSVLELIGASTVTTTSFTFPCLFYIYLAAGEKKSLEREHFGNQEPLTFREMIQRTSWRTLILSGILIGCSALIGIISTITAVKGIVHEHFEPPCYLKFLFKPENSTETGYINCCGHEQTVTRITKHGEVCINPDPHYY